MADDARVGDDLTQPQLQVDFALKGTRTEGHEGMATRRGALPASLLTHVKPDPTWHPQCFPHPHSGPRDQERAWLPQTIVSEERG